MWTTVLLCSQFSSLLPNVSLWLSYHFSFFHPFSLYSLRQRVGRYSHHSWLGTQAAGFIIVCHKFSGELLADIGEATRGGRVRAHCKGKGSIELGSYVHTIHSLVVNYIPQKCFPTSIVWMLSLLSPLPWFFVCHVWFSLCTEESQTYCSHFIEDPWTKHES